ncbi:hypothetical protein [Scleromatobacter humisilvae]|uniref:DUF3558 domain-containing protein n=1 Tax=Scleromatobacter humisilvae TaxID=2897159 RepID=A0A9X1YK17_9BURK|nr:hypothetical protein [Scleromatobacter humisilvae]MCK9686820.1 hypothetical protein [Scleromatobacter humisilvae]
MSSSGLSASSVAVLVLLLSSGPTIAAPRTACDLLTLDDVRALVGAPVSIFAPELSTPAVRGDLTVSTCTYVLKDAAGHLAKGRGAKFSLMWAPQAKLQEASDFYVKRHAEAPGIKGDVLVLAWVGDASAGIAGDWDASQRLLAAVLRKL